MENWTFLRISPSFPGINLHLHRFMDFIFQKYEYRNPSLNVLNKFQKYRALKKRVLDEGTFSIRINMHRCNPNFQVPFQ